MSATTVFIVIYAISFVFVAIQSISNFVQTRRTKITHFLLSARTEKATRGDLVSMSLSSLFWTIMPGFNMALACANTIVNIIVAIRNRKKGKIYRWWKTPL